MRASIDQIAQKFASKFTGGVNKSQALSAQVTLTDDRFEPQESKYATSKSKSPPALLKPPRAAIPLDELRVENIKDKI